MFEDRVLNHMSFWQGFKLVMRSKTYLILLGLFLWVWMSNAVIQTNSLLFTKYVVRHQAAFSYLLVCENYLYIDTIFVDCV